MKIAIGGLACECCTFSPWLSRAEDFRVARGAALLEAYAFLQSYPEVQPVGLLQARALPGGPLEASFYAQVKQEFLQMLAQCGPLDGLFLHMHGAVKVDGLQDAEGDFMAAIREVVGPACFIAASYDLHGNVSPRVMQQLDLLSAYRTAPHVDWYETLERTFALLVRCLRAGAKPHKAFIAVPILLSGEKTSTEWEPAASLYRQIPGLLAGDAVLDASILIGYVWADEPRATACVTAFGMDRDRVEQAAQTLARQFWAARRQFDFDVPAGSVDECIALALQAPERPVVISDSGDNPTAGGSGDTPYVLERLLALGVPDAVFASIADPAAVARCQAAGVGAALQLSLGGKLDPVHARALSVPVRVVSLHALPWAQNRPADPGLLNHMAVVAAQGVQVILTERRTPFHYLKNFTDLGIDPTQHKIVVVKIGYLVPELKALAAKALLALSPGTVNQDTLHLNYTHIRRPMFPFDPNFEWAP